MMKKMLSVKSLSKEFNGEKAVDSVSFEADAGDVFGLLGPNGAGKTTTLRMIATTIKPSSGNAQVFGFSITKEPSNVRQVVGILTAAIGLYGRLTARENLRYFGRLYGLSGKKLEERINELIKLLDMASFADRKTENFSTGMLQKVAIGRAILHDPPVLILDEPTTGLDVIAAQTVVNFIRQAREMGKCVILSTHIMSEAQKLCKRAAIIHQGKIIINEEISSILKKTDKLFLEDAFMVLVKDNEKN
ncbi:hypothetical protein LCGC14_0848270 [marine sediment metagenome]|uniref:ABC transporter domain-containing protein n=1 Tax=marine sediment metagenome TaxID=412755 RepID=A0A0F9RVV0_9ZZZZ|nr:ATP-binding cassette domain-containing protein [Actinomycetota bacterium]